MLIVEITEPGASPAITPVRTGELTWTVLDEDLRESGDLRRLMERVETISNPENTLLSVSLSGLITANEREELAHLTDILHSRFLSGRIVTSNLMPSPEDESWLSGIPPGVVLDAACRLREMATEGGESSREAARALMELYSIALEVGK